MPLDRVKRYRIIRCPRCGLPQYVLAGQKTRQCPRGGCGYRIPVATARILLETDDQRAAVEIVKELKYPPAMREFLTQL